MRRHDFFERIGLVFHKASYTDIWISTLGGIVGILGIFLASEALFGHDVAVTIVPSMGASAVLLFAAPHAPFSQPWNVVAGHLLSAVIGVACWRWIPHLAVAASVGVGLAIGAMYLARCLHPPGGATALAAVIGSAQLHALGFGYALQPILFNVAVITLIAVMFNGLFNWRRYPAQLSVRAEAVAAEADEYAPISHEDFVYALSQIDTIVDASEDDLLQIYRLATKRHRDTDHRAADTRTDQENQGE
jgi:CBS-domain-containing membrane protein